MGAGEACMVYMTMGSCIPNAVISVRGVQYAIIPRKPAGFTAQYSLGHIDTPIDLSQDLRNFAYEARPVRGTEFLSWQWRFCLDVRQVQKMLKRVTLGVGQDPDVKSTHSLRVAGALAVANRGVQDHFIQSVGRW
jgi:hypothetical protein